MNDLKKLYSNVIKAHNDAPYHFEKMNDATSIIKSYNPICGDRFEMYLNESTNIIGSAYFHGFGCAISKASTSLLIKSIEGKTIAEAKNICDKFLQFMDKESQVDTLTLTNEFQAFAGVHDFPERYDCATLSWRELKKYLENSIK